MVDVVTHRQTITANAATLKPMTMPDIEHLAGMRRPGDAASRWGTPAQISQYGFGRGNYAPEGFWQSQDGIGEAKRRIGAFVEREGRVPTSHEISSIGLSYFYKLQRTQGKTLKDMLELTGHSKTQGRCGTYSREEMAMFGMPGHFVPNGFWKSQSGIEEAGRRITDFITRTGHAPTNTDMRRMGLQGFYKANNLSSGNWLERMMELTGNQDVPAAWNTPSVIALYGVDIRAPRQFWKTEQGMAECRRRLDLFLKMNGVLPHIPQLEGLGLSGAYVSWHLDGRRGYDMMLKELDYEDSLLGRKGRRPLSNGLDAQSRVYGLLLRAPVSFWTAKEGWEEAFRRLMAFRTEHGRLPNGSEFSIKLGLNAFYEQNVPRGMEYTSGLKHIFGQAHELARYYIISVKRD